MGIFEDIRKARELKAAEKEANAPDYINRSYADIFKDYQDSSGKALKSASVMQALSSTGQYLSNQQNINDLEITRTPNTPIPTVSLQSYNMADPAINKLNEGFNSMLKFTREGGQKVNPLLLSHYAKAETDIYAKQGEMNNDIRNKESLTNFQAYRETTAANTLNNAKYNEASDKLDIYKTGMGMNNLNQYAVGVSNISNMKMKHEADLLSTELGIKNLQEVKEMEKLRLSQENALFGSKPTEIKSTVYGDKVADLKRSFDFTQNTTTTPAPIPAVEVKTPSINKRGVIIPEDDNTIVDDTDLDSINKELASTANDQKDYVAKKKESITAATDPNSLAAAQLIIPEAEDVVKENKKQKTISGKSEAINLKIPAKKDAVKEVEEEIGIGLKNPYTGLGANEQTPDSTAGTQYVDSKYNEAGDKKTTKPKAVVSKEVANAQGEQIRKGFTVPIKGGKITEGFGINDGEVKGTKTRNNGVTISTNGEKDLTSVSDGVITKHVQITPNKHAVMVRSGEYTIVYSNIGNKDSLPKVGASVKAGDIIGDMTGKKALDFQVFRTYEKNGETNTEKIDPEKFIKS